MWLINTKTLELTYFAGDAQEYAILSHRWEKEEILFEDVSKIPLSRPDNPARSKFGFAKVMGTCALAASDGYEWVWIDSCCIDKSSSAELQESINSMFRWYRQAQVCYAYLSDVGDESSGWSKDFEKSQWFSRGWTLQELLAPSNVEFYSADWSPIGTKLCRTELIASITGIETEALEFDWGSKEDEFCAAQKFSWAAHRQVSKAEDSSYCLFGLFNVNMPLLYGEGEEKAFRRLQQAIFEETADHTLFLFAWAPKARSVPMLASWITRFCRRPQCLVCRTHQKCFPSNIRYSEIIPALSKLFDEYGHYIRIVRQGVMIKLPLMEYSRLHGINTGGQRWDLRDKYVAILPLRSHGHKNALLGIVLQRVSPFGYIRLCTEAALLRVDTLKIDQNREEAYTVYNESALASIDPVRYSKSFTTPLKMVHFKFSSQFFKPFDWRWNAQHGPLMQTDVKASFPMPKQQDNRFLITVSFGDVLDQDMVGVITLWYSMNKIGLQDISFSRGQRCLGRWGIEPNHQSQRYMRIVVPISESGDSFRVLLRRISIPEHMWTRVAGKEFLAFLNHDQNTTWNTGTGQQYEIQAGYRLYVTHEKRTSL